MRNDNQSTSSNEVPIQRLSFRNKIGSHMKFTPIIIGVLILLCLTATVVYFLGAQKITHTIDLKNIVPSSTETAPTLIVSPDSTTTFQDTLMKNCVNEVDNKSLSGEIDLKTLPLALGITDLKTEKGNCDSDFAKYVNISLGEENSFMTISDKNSYHCCHGPSSIKAAGKLIKTNGDVSIYIHTGTWASGPNSSYKPIVARGIRNFMLSNGEEIKVVLDKTAIDNTTANLQQIEDKYQVIDPLFDSGTKVLTPETVEKMLTDSFFANIGDSDVIKKIESDLLNISLKN